MIQIGKKQMNNLQNEFIRHCNIKIVGLLKGFIISFRNHSNKREDLKINSLKMFFNLDFI